MMRRPHAGAVLRVLLVALSTALLVLVAQPSANSWQIPKSNGPACLSVTPDAWNTSYSSAGFWTYSGSNLTATLAAPGFNQETVVLGSRCQITGKYYFEVLSPLTGGADRTWGIAAANHPNNVQLGNHNTPNESIGLNDNNGGWRYDGGCCAFVGLFNPTNGQSLGFAVDLTTGCIWARNPSVSPTTWYGSNTSPADPATGTNCQVFTSFAVPVYISMSSNQNGSPNSVTLHATLGSFVAAPPTGFSAWQP